MYKTTGQEIVGFKSDGINTLHLALVHSVPREIMQMLLEQYSPNDYVI